MGDVPVRRVAPKVGGVTVLPETEAGFMGWVIDLATYHGWLVAHFRAAKMGDGRWVTPMVGDPGFPDLVLARRGDVIFAELKVGRGKVSAVQKAWLEALRSSEWERTHEVYLWRPEDRDEIEGLLR